MIQRFMMSMLFCACVASLAVAQPSTKSLRAAGRVDAVTADSMTIQLPGDDKLVLVVDKATKITGRGTESRATTGGQGAVTDRVRPSDTVVVTYRTDASGGLVATEVHVRAAAK